ncbi:MAG TPA: S41 family peptidase, partial [Pyrinomonadaceae bacterium]|nr:S41 family peptidase [Pyrinomonadaceae bacterium]
MLAVSNAQSIEQKRDRGHEMLMAIKDDLKKNYYDPSFHGMDLDARFKTADERIKNAMSNGDINGIIAQVLVELNDSHTFFIPPTQLVEVDYGFKVQTIGETCYVVVVKAGSDAEAKGLKVGDIVHSIDGFTPSRANLWKIEYSYYVLQPRPGMRLVVRDLNGQLHEVEMGMKVLKFKEREFEAKKEKPLLIPRYKEIGDSLIIYKLPHFNLSDGEIDEVMKRVEPHKSLVLDLRDNPGGHVKTLLRFIGYFFDHDIKIGEMKTRNGLE